MNTRVWALLIALTFACGQVSADVIYRETFGRPTPGDLSVNLFDWADFVSAGTYNTDTVNSGINGSNNGRTTWRTSMLARTRMDRPARWP